MNQHTDHFPDWEEEAERVKEELGNKINRMSKKTIVAHIELNYLAKILVEIFLDQTTEEEKKKKQIKQPTGVSPDLPS